MGGHGHGNGAGNGTRVIEVRLLGPPRVERDGDRVAFDTRKAVALLAYLAVTDRARSRDALADLLWPGTDPERARGALRRTLSSLRSAIGADLIEATHDHVRLIKGPTITVDVDRFRDLREAGAVDRACALAGGDFLEGFTVRDAPDFEDWAQAEAEGLRRELAGALHALAGEREAAGDLPGAVAAVQRWLALDPLHEPAHRALIRLHATSGDRAAALLQYRDCVRTLSRELGVPPLAETTELYQQINRGTYEPTRASGGGPPASPPVATAPEPPPFVGRAEDLRRLRAVYDAVRDDGRVVLVEGEAGIGKTRLVEELLSSVRAQGGRVVSGRAYEDEAGLAYAPVVAAFRDRLHDADDWRAHTAAAALAEAARLVPELRVEDAHPPRDTGDDGPGAEARFLAGVWETLTVAARGNRPGVLFVDDAQWADDATQSLLAYGVRRLAGRPLLVVLTWRTPADGPLRRAASEAVAAGGGAVVELERLAESDVGELVASAGADPDLSHRLWERTEGVPLLLVEYLRAAEEGSAEVPARARDLLRARLTPVTETGRQVLSAAAVIGRSFDAETVREVSGRTDEETVAALEEVVRRGVVREGTADYDFSHELLRGLVYAETSLARRRLLHRRAAGVPGTPPAAVARHLQLAGRDAEAAEAFRRAAGEARVVFANAEALEHLRTALALGHPDRSGLLTELGDLLTVTGDYAEALASLEAAAAEQPEAGVEVARRLGRLQHRRGEYALAERHLTDALDATPAGDAAARSGVTADLALTAHSLGDRSRARALAEAALELAERSGDPRSLCQAHNLLGLLATEDGDPAGALDHLRDSRELADRTGDPDLRVAALNNLALAHRARDELDVSIELTEGALELCAAVGDRHREAALHNNLADLLHASGRPDEAMTHLTEAVRIFAEVGAEEEPRPEIWKLVRW
jgi:DNA-binding SARP family transcriptional activator/Tfp pilus assembly protein PilF